MVEQYGDVILKRSKEQGLVISRVPKYIRDGFILLAEEEFADDYGMTLAQIFKEAIEYRQLKTMFFNNQIGIKVGFEEKKTEEEQKAFMKKMLDGSSIKLKDGGNNG